MTFPSSLKMNSGAPKPYSPTRVPLLNFATREETCQGH